jgi:hypothetical protein
MIVILLKIDWKHQTVSIFHSLDSLFRCVLPDIFFIFRLLLYTNYRHINCHLLFSLSVTLNSNYKQCSINLTKLTASLSQFSAAIRVVSSTVWFHLSCSQFHNSNSFWWSHYINIYVCYVFIYVKKRELHGNEDMGFFVCICKWHKNGVIH